MSNDADTVDELIRRADDAIAANQEILDSVGPFRPRTKRAHSAERFFGVNR